jgi:hypothetical protein
MDKATLGIILAIIAILLMYPVGLLINLTTPLVANLIASRSKASLIKRIARLENELDELEKIPPISDVENEILWKLTNLKMTIIGFSSIVMMVMYMGIRVVSDPNNASLTTFATTTAFVVISNFALQLWLYFHRDFRTLRSPDRRKNLRSTIENLKKLREDWP